ncbi:MAG: TdeIII family type II restriction endonuclease [Chlorobi bacterium]|nr:TdeIII family type II restriction endonuclease [Chlorobiota bacterium]
MAKIESSIREAIKDMLIRVVTQKLREYKPETENMPFHYRLIGKDKYAIFSFIQSINTTFGMSIWEQTALLLANDKWTKVQRQVDVVNDDLVPCKQRDAKARRVMYQGMRDAIETYMTQLSSGNRQANKRYEVSLLRRSFGKGPLINVDKECADLYLRSRSGKEYFIDITSAKPNIKEFKAMKRKILEWQAIRLTGNLRRRVEGRIAIPYNPYYPKPYERWTLRGLYDLDRNEVMVGEEFWNFVAQDDVYHDLLEVFEQAGKYIRPIIDKTFAKFK